MVQALSVSSTSTGSRKSVARREASTRLAPCGTTWMRDGRSGASSAIATRGSDFGAVSLGKRESCRMAAEHSSDRSRAPSSAQITIRMFDASDLRLYRARSFVAAERHTGAGGGPDGKEEGLEEGRQEGHQAINQEKELAQEVARKFRAAS